MNLSSSTELTEKLKKIQKIFPREEIASLVMDKKRIQEYYRVNKTFYSFFLPSADFIYVGISRDGKFKQDDLLEAVRIVNRYIVLRNAESVLELATGRGANSFFLAREFSHTKFCGIDISESQLEFARKRATKIANYHPEYGDYHDLSRYASNTFDIVFVVEALCYSTEKEKVLHEVNRVLKPGGYFIIFDGYLAKERSALNTEEQLACLYTERGMGLKEFEWYASFDRTARVCGFSNEYEENVSSFTLPMLEYLERMAKKFFDHPVFVRCMRLCFPKIFLYNAMSGYLMATAVREGLFSYVITILKKQVYDSEN